MAMETSRPNASDRTYPATVLLIHPKENRAKCSLEPLRGRDDMRFVKYVSGRTIELPRYVRLSIDGPPLTPTDADCGILIVDASWRYAEPMHAEYAAVPPRSLAGFHTAYPRTSKLFQDPTEGLASIEALYIAYRILGRPTDGLLNQYYWRETFLERNGWLDDGGRPAAWSRKV